METEKQHSKIVSPQSIYRQIAYFIFILNIYKINSKMVGFDQHFPFILYVCKVIENEKIIYTIDST